MKKKKIILLGICLGIIVILTLGIFLFYNGIIFNQKITDKEILNAFSLSASSLNFRNPETNQVTITPYKETIPKYRVIITGNESITLNGSFEKVKDDYYFIGTPKFSNELIKEELVYDSKIENYTLENITYYQKTSLKISDKDRNVLGYLSKNLTSNEFRYKIPRGTTWIKLGEQSIIIIGDSTFDSINVNVTNENKFSHLNISTDAPYDDLTVYLPIDANVSSAITYDYTDNNYDAALNSDAQFNSSGLFGGALELDGTGDHAVISSLDLTATDQVTISFWIKPDTLSTSNDMLFELSPNQGSRTDSFLINFAASEQSEITMTGDVGLSAWKTLSPLPPDRWTHLVAVFDKSLSALETKAYVNGSLDGGNIFGNADNTNNFGNQNLYIGSRAGTVEFFDGKIDEIMIFSTALDASQILQIFNNQSSKFAHFGTQLFNDTNVSNAGGGGNENRLNITFTNYTNLFGSNVSVVLNGGTEINFSADGILNNLVFTDDPNTLNITFKYQAGNSNFYSPLIIENITLDSFFFDAEPGVCNAPPASGNWDCDCSTNAVFTTNDEIVNGNASFVGSGIITFHSNLTFTTIGSYVFMEESCQIDILRSGGFITHEP